jgi:hypothetical protein
MKAMGMGGHKECSRAVQFEAVFMASTPRQRGAGAAAAAILVGSGVSASARDPVFRQDCGLTLFSLQPGYVLLIVSSVDGDCVYDAPVPCPQQRQKRQDPRRVAAVQ